jgi:hypothetical protein
MKIAVYAIAKDEAKHLDRFLEGCKGADQIVIVDTGSTDGTWEMLQDRPVEAHRAILSPFRFDHARNIALGHVDPSMDVCVSLDLDEVPDPGFFDKLRESWKSDTGRAWVMWDTGTIWANNLRVHARNGYTWKYPCHEITVCNKDSEVEVVVDTCVRHLPDNSKSRSSYLELLKLGHAEEPHDARMLVYLIREYFFAHQWVEVIEHCKKLEAVESLYWVWDVELSQSWRLCGQSYTNIGDINAAEQWFKRAVEALPSEPEPWLTLAHHYYQREMWQQCYDAAIKIDSDDVSLKEHYISDSDSDWKTYDLLAISCWNLGEHGSAKRYARKAYELNSDDQRLRDNYDTIVRLTASVSVTVEPGSWFEYRLV